MSLLNGKRIILGISGSIAAFKAPIILRLLVKAGAEVKVVLTDSAKQFVTPLTLSTLSKNKVYCSFMNDDENSIWNNHVELGMWADLMLIAPVSANTISKMVSSNSDNFLIATYLSSKCPVFFAPAMDLDMHKHPSVQNNIKKLIEFGNFHIPSTSGSLASGLDGKGRMEEPENIINFLIKYFEKKSPLFKKKILVTAGPTYEPIDSVRFIGNFSTGKMGYAIANEASNQGADVTLISGPTNGLKINDNVSVKNIVTSDEMFNKCKDEFVKCEVLIMAAAVADIKPLKVYKSKMKKSLIKSTLEINSTVDILYELGKKKGSKIIIGFALENVNSVVNAEKKLKSKNLDGIVLNSLDNENSCFGSETNKITFLNKKGERNVYPTKDKKLVAKDILQHVKQMF